MALHNGPQMTEEQYVNFTEIVEEFDDSGSCEVTYKMLFKLQVPIDLLNELRARYTADMARHARI